MDEKIAREIFSALSNHTRLDVFRLLVKSAPEGLPAGVIARRLGVVQNTMSSHLGVLSRCGVIKASRHGRTIVYSASFGRIRQMLLFLMQDCCQGAPEICAPLLESMACGPADERIVR